MRDTADTSAPRPTPRASDAEREAAAELVRAAAGDGRIELAELDERLNAVYQSRTRAELATTTADLEPHPTSTKPLTLRTKSGVMKRTDRWNVPAEIIAESTSGYITLDFTQATVGHRIVSVHATTKSGQILLIVPLGWAVVMDEVTTTSGTVRNKVGGDPATARHCVQVIGSATSGTIKARHPRRSFIDWLLRRPHRPR